MASNTTNHKEETNVKHEEKTQENNKQTMLAVKGRLTLKNKPVNLEVGVDLLEYHRANAEALHRLSTEDEKPTLRDIRRKDHIGEAVLSAVMRQSKLEARLRFAVCWDRTDMLEAQLAAIPSWQESRSNILRNVLQLALELERPAMVKARCTVRAAPGRAAAGRAPQPAAPQPAAQQPAAPQPAARHERTPVPREGARRRLTTRAAAA